MARLTKREREVLEKRSDGLTAKEMAYVLGIAERTVEAHMNNIYKKFEVHTFPQALRIWWEGIKEAEDD